MLSLKNILPILAISFVLPASVFAISPISGTSIHEASPSGLVKKLENKIEKRISKIELLPVFLNNSVISSLGTNSLVVSHEGKTYTINIDAKTQLSRRFWGKMQFSEMQVGDKVNIVGRWTDDTKTALLASHIRDLSLQKRNGVFIGKVTAVTSASWTIDTPNRGTQTVTFSSTTKVTNRKGQSLKSSDVLVDHIIRVRGLWDKQANNITEVSAVKDYTLPLQPKASASPSATPAP